MENGYDNILNAESNGKLLNRRKVKHAPIEIEIVGIICKCKHEHSTWKSEKKGVTTDVIDNATWRRKKIIPFASVQHVSDKNGWRFESIGGRKCGLILARIDASKCIRKSLHSVHKNMLCSASKRRGEKDVEIETNKTEFAANVGKSIDFLRIHFARFSKDSFAFCRFFFPFHLLRKRSTQLSAYKQHWMPVSSKIVYTQPITLAFASIYSGWMLATDKWWIREKNWCHECKKSW